MMASGYIGSWPWVLDQEQLVEMLLSKLVKNGPNTTTRIDSGTREDTVENNIREGLKFARTQMRTVYERNTPCVGKDGKTEGQKVSWYVGKEGAQGKGRGCGSLNPAEWTGFLVLR